MNGLTTGAAKKTNVGVRGLRTRSARGRRSACSDHLRRLCDSLAEATRLIPLSGGGTVDEKPFLRGRADKLDMLAFAVAVDGVLFLDAAREGNPISPETGTLLGRTVAAIDRLLHSLGESPKSDSRACLGESRLCDAMGSLGKTVTQVRTKLADLSVPRGVARFHSPGKSRVRCANQAGRRSGGGQN
jgi:hypothetical protein